MADEHTSRGLQQDRDRIAANQDYEVEYVAKKMGVTKQAVIDAIKKVGNMRSAVEDELRKGGK